LFGLEEVLVGEEGFGSSQHEEPVFENDLCETIEEIQLEVLLEINRHIPAEHEVENAEAG
jgi:hypothetical protein